MGIRAILFLQLLLKMIPLAGGDSTSSAVGITGRGFVLLATDTAFRRGAQVISRDIDLITRLGPRTILASCGDLSSGGEFASFLARNFALRKIIHGRPQTTRSAAHFARHNIARLMRKSPVQADFLLAGVDEDMESTNSWRSPDGLPSASGQPQLHWIDRAGSCCELPYACQGPASAMVLAFLDEGWHEGMELDEALDLLKRCIAQLAGRYAMSPQGWRVNLVDGKGSRLVLVLKRNGSVEVSGLTEQPL